MQACVCGQCSDVSSAGVAMYQVGLFGQKRPRALCCMRSLVLACVSVSGRQLDAIVRVRAGAFRGQRSDALGHPGYAPGRAGRVRLWSALVGMYVGPVRVCAPSHASQPLCFFGQTPFSPFPLFAQILAGRVPFLKDSDDTTLALLQRNPEVKFSGPRWRDISEARG